MKKRIFTDFVVQLREDKQPGKALCDEVWKQLERLLYKELKRRGLRRSPEILGFCGVRWEDGPMEDLVADAFEFSILRRQGLLMDLSREQNDIDPMIWRNVRNFMTELHQKTDPVGYPVFTRYRKAVRRLLEQGEARIRPAEGSRCNGDLRGGSVVELVGGEQAEVSCRRRLSEIVVRWNHDLMPELVTARTRSVERTVLRLKRRLVSLPTASVWAFRSGDLVGEMQRDARQRWQTALETSYAPCGWEIVGDSEEDSLPIQCLEDPLASRQTAQRIEATRRAIRREQSPKMKRDLWNLWKWIEENRLPDSAEPFPSLSELGRIVEMPRARVAQLLRRLREIMA